MNSLSNEGKCLESMDISLEKEKEAMLSREEEEPAAAAESEMKKDVTVLRVEKSTEQAGEQIAFSSRITVENWKIITDKWRSDPNSAVDFQVLLHSLEHVAYANEHCSDSVKTLATSVAELRAIDNNEFNRLRAENSALRAKGTIQNYLEIVRDKVVDVYTQLLVLSGLVNQADRSHTGTGSKRSLDRMSSDSMYAKDRPRLPQQVGSGLLGTVKHKEELKSFRSDAHPIGDFDALDQQHQTALRSFSGSLENCFQHASIFNDCPDKKKYKEALCTLESVLDGAAETSSRGLLLIPGPKAEEVSFAQPYLLALLQAVGLTIDNLGVRENSPGKTNIQTNRVVPQTEFRSERIADKSVAANGRFIFRLRDDSVEIPVEEKPGEREGSNPEALCDECTRQVLSHLAKQVGIAFNFAGIGIDARATGVMLTAAYVKIVQLRLENMGTANMKLIQLETKRMPLLTKTSFEKWVEGRESKWENVKRDLYGDGTTGISNNADVPSGLVAIWNLMTSSRVDLVGPSPFVSGEIGDRIGFGAFSTVHQAKDNNGKVIKVSRYGAKAALDREAEVLRKLQTPSAGIVQLVEAKDLSVQIGGIDVPMPALILAPHGISFEKHLAGLANKDKEGMLRKMGEELVAALDFIHGRGYTHNDVSPKNILFDRSRKRPFLVDFGLASQHSENIIGFCGTPRYAHRHVFGKYPKKLWKAKPVYDKSSLAFSMADLSTNGQHPWKSFQPFDFSAGKNAERKIDFNSWAEKRSSIAWSWLEREDFSNSEFDWKFWCSDGSNGD